MVVAGLVPVIGSLTSVEVGHTKIGKEMALELISIFKQKQMTFVGLADCDLGPDGANVAAEYISDSCSLTSINLSDNFSRSHRIWERIWEGPEFGKAIAEGIRVSGSLTSINLADNYLTFGRDMTGIKA